MFIRKQSYVCPFCETKKRLPHRGVHPTCKTCGRDLVFIDRMPKTGDRKAWQALRRREIRRDIMAGFRAIHDTIRACFSSR